jgi:undecaprenyl-phosphate galactose phosphotransferase
LFFNRQRLGPIILFLSDIVILLFIAVIAIVIRNFLPDIISDFPIFSKKINYAWWFFLVWLAILAYEGAYTRKFTFWDEVKMLWKVSFFSTITILSIFFLGKMGVSVSRTVIVLIGIISLPVFPLLRIALKRWLIGSGILTSRVLILGANEIGRLALKALHREKNLGYQVVGFLDDLPSPKSRLIDGLKVHAHLDQIERYLRNADVQGLVIALPNIERGKLWHLVNRLQHKVGSVLYFPDVTGLAVMGTELRQFFYDQAFALEIKNNLAQPFIYLLKKMSDYFFGAILLVVLIIPFLVLSLCIIMTSPGPPMYKQKRVGKNCKPFFCYKFRTMYKNADERLQEMLRTDPEARAEWNTSWKLKNDPRITPLGNFLRKTSLDELPQIFNMLRGEMSLVGPRPVTQEEIDRYYKDSASLCFSVQPGITGLWQVSGRSNTSYDYRVSLDSWYVRNWNLWLDFVILAKTVIVVIKKEGAR